MLSDLRGRRVTVMGLGRFGGGVGAVRFLVDRGAHVTVTDLADEPTLAGSLTEIADLKLERLRLGSHDEADFRHADLIVASPAVPVDHPLLRAAESVGIPITTEIGLFWEHCRGHVVGVTGCVGKSTTAAMIHAILVASGRRTWLGGNLGGSLLPDVERIASDDWVVLELSSFQLERLAALKPRPAVAVVTNFRPNHLDRHGTLGAYRAAKQNLLRWQMPGDVAVLNADDPDVSRWSTAARAAYFASGPLSARRAGESIPTRRACGGQHECEVAPRDVFLDGTDLVFASASSDIRLPLALGVPGDHHRLNAAAAATAASAVGAEPETIIASLKAFRGLPHRSEVLGEFDGRLWVNDSKATTPESAIAALRSFDRPVRLVAGGADKGVNLAPLADEITRRSVAVFLSGTTAPTLAALLAERLGRAVVCESFDASVAAACADSRPGDVILLSPGCASWGQFRDYRERGERFAALARAFAASSLSESRA